jgi:hypothetical protein
MDVLAIPVQQRQGIHRGWPSTYFFYWHVGNLEIRLFQHAYILLLFCLIEFSTKLISFDLPSFPLSRIPDRIHENLRHLRFQGGVQSTVCTPYILVFLLSLVRQYNIVDPVTVQFSIFWMENHPRDSHVTSSSLSFFLDIHGYPIPCNHDRVRSAILQIRAIAIVRRPASCQFPLAWKKVTVHRYIPSTYQALPWLAPMALEILPRLFGRYVINS